MSRVTTPSPTRLATLMQLAPAELAAADAQHADRQPKLLGLPLWTEGRRELFAHLTERVQNAPPGARPLELHSVNAEISVQVRDDDAYRELLVHNPINIPDGEWVKRLAGFKYKQRFERISGSDLVTELCAHAEAQGWSVFLLGAAEDVSARAAQVLAARFPRLELERLSPPYEPRPDVSPATTTAILDAIAKAHPTVVIACLGSPKQELWFREHEAQLVASGVRVVMGAGGSLDFLAGAVRRAPRAVSNLGLEWAWRLALQPRARFRRMATRLPRFLALGLADALAGRLQTPRPPAKL